MEIRYNKDNEIDLPVSPSLEKNIEALDSIFSEWGDIVKKKFVLERGEDTLDMYIIYIDGLTDNEMVERTITRPLLYEWRNAGSEDTENTKEKKKAQGDSVFNRLFHNQTEAVDLTEKETMMDAVSAVLKTYFHLSLAAEAREERQMLQDRAKISTSR